MTDEYLTINGQRYVKIETLHKCQTKLSDIQADHWIQIRRMEKLRELMFEQDRQIAYSKRAINVVEGRKKERPVMDILLPKQPEQDKIR